jgi:hypothetical protein
MTLYRVSTDRLDPVQRTTFAAESLLERKDLQRLLRHDITPIGDDLMVIAEEYGDWEESNRRIDLLCLSKSAGMVVVEIKRTEDGGHMELQAIRYAAMVSGMTFEQVVAAYADSKRTEPDLVRDELLEFLEVGSEEEVEWTGDVRIVLVSADFSTELTTAVLWLNLHDLEITCIRLRPYRMGAEVLVDATQIIPLPEAEDYAVKLRAQGKEKKKVLGVRQEIFRKFWSQLIERATPRTPLLSGRSTTKDHWLNAGIGRARFTLSLVLRQHDAQVECYIKLGGEKALTLNAYHSLLAMRESIEAAFGGELHWHDLPEKQGCRISAQLEGGWRAPEEEWPDLQDRLIGGVIRLERALKGPVGKLSL